MSQEPRRLSWQEYEERMIGELGVRAARSRGRRHPEPEHPLRSPFQRDRDRIVHSRAFRRLEYKTQVFVPHEKDHFRTRLTHTLEVSVISRTIARGLGLNEDLTETVALAHDLGHSPFGHAGERALDGLMKAFGGFEHNLQSLRVVGELECKYPGFSGLNLSFEVLEGLTKHGAAGAEPWLDEAALEHRSRPLESQIVDLCDELAYVCHDLDDGSDSGLLTQRALGEVTLWRETLASIKAAHPQLSGSVLRQYAVRTIIDRMVTDILTAVPERIARARVRSLEDVLAAGPLAAFSPEMTRKFGELKKFLMENLYTHPRVMAQNERAENMLRRLFAFYLENPGELEHYAAGYRQARPVPERMVCDYIAGMTDRFAEKEFARLMR